jgi:hypothetical protein
VALLGEAFSPSLGLQRGLHPSAFDVVRSDRSALWAAKKRRRRKQPPMDPSTSTEKNAPESIPSTEETFELGEVDEDEEVDISQIADVANFKFDGDISGSGRSFEDCC